MILLDTNVLSEVMKSNPDPRVVDWLDNQPRISIWTTSITILEIRFGLRLIPAGKRRESLMQAFDLALTHTIERRIAPLDAAAAEHAAILMASRQESGKPQELRDTMIAGIALASKASLATRNVSHFPDLHVPVINPWLYSTISTLGSETSVPTLGCQPKASQDP